MKEIRKSEKELSNRNTPSNSFKVRRKLLKGGAVAAPVVLTLKSGSALAMTSTQQCIARSKDLANVTNPKQFTNVGEGAPFLRTLVERIALVEISFDIGTSSWVSVTGDKTTAFPIYQHSGTTISDTWADTSTGVDQKLFTAETAPITVYATAGGTVLKSNALHFIDGTKHYYAKNQRSKEGLVVTDMNGDPLMDKLGGNQVGRFVGTSNLTGSDHITVSCWTSVNP